jgi:hypothetical protein
VTKVSLRYGINVKKIVSGESHAFPSGAPEFIYVLFLVRYFLCIIVKTFIYLFVIFLAAIALSVRNKEITKWTKRISIIALFGMLYSKMNNICNTCVGNLEHLY